MACACPDVETADTSQHQLPKKSIPWDKFNSWMSCFCVVGFDLELGQVIEKVYPEHYFLSEVERTSICYLAFPDSNSGCMGDTHFHFRIRSTFRAKRSNNPYDAVLLKDPEHYYGHVTFRQVKDISVKRGYFQKSLVLISRYPFTNLYIHLVKTIAPEYFENGDIALETVCYQIDKWTNPRPGEVLQLPAMGKVLSVIIPPCKTKFLERKSTQNAPVSPVDFQCTFLPPYYKHFSALLPNLTLLWELVLLGEPIIVMAPSPSISSEVVQSLVSLIQPLKFSCDYRPYFTIHDKELKEYTAKASATPNVILGVTNPFFAKTLQQWPHIVRVGEMPTLAFNKNGKRSLVLHPGIYTRYKPCLGKDKLFLKKIGKGTNGTRPMEVQDAMITNYISELTYSFMIPLERYIGSLMPLQRSISPWKCCPKLRKFNIEEFIQTLPGYGPQLTSKIKSDWPQLYRKFFKSPNFENWFDGKKQQVNQKLELLHLEALCQADIAMWIDKREEVEIVDIYMQTEKKYSSNRNPLITGEIRTQLQAQMEIILNALPADLKEVIQKS